MEGIESAGFIFYNRFDSANLDRVVFVPNHHSTFLGPSDASFVTGKGSGPSRPSGSAIVEGSAPFYGSSGASGPSIGASGPSFAGSGASQETSVGSSGTKLQNGVDAEFNMWTRPDCYGTEFENGNRTWFYFGVKAPAPSLLVRFNLVDLNRQSKMYAQGMAPVYRIVPGKPHWERIKDRPIHHTVDDIFTLSFKFKMSENVHSIAYFAFTYPYSYADLHRMLQTVDDRFHPQSADDGGAISTTPRPSSLDDIYYVKETVCRSLQGRDVWLLTVTSHHGIQKEREVRLKNLFPEKNTERPFKFIGKKVIFISARVHPGETPSTYVFNGLLHLLLNRDDPVAVTLRRLYVFKMIPFLNPDGVALGHYRTDTRGCNLNRVYLNPSLTHHPSIYAARSLLRYYHWGCEKNDDENEEPKDVKTSASNSSINAQVSHMKLDEEQTSEQDQNDEISQNSQQLFEVEEPDRDECKTVKNVSRKAWKVGKSDKKRAKVDGTGGKNEIGDCQRSDSGIFLYVDLHGHASKKGIFMYGNHFTDFDDKVECMLLPKLMSLNNHNFHFTACNFTERNMYLKDRRDGMSREGSGRVAVLKMCGLVRSYTLECNYNTGRVVNVLPPSVREGGNKQHHVLAVPPKYTPNVFEEVGASLAASILDLTGHNPLTRIPNSEFHNLTGVKCWLRVHCGNEMPAESKLSMPVSNPAKNRGKQGRSGKLKCMRPVTAPVSKRQTPGGVNKMATVGAMRPRTVTMETRHNKDGGGGGPTVYCSKRSAGVKLKDHVTTKKLSAVKSTSVVARFPTESHELLVGGTQSSKPEDVSTTNAETYSLHSFSKTSSTILFKKSKFTLKKTKNTTRKLITIAGKNMTSVMDKKRKKMKVSK